MFMDSARELLIGQHLISIFFMYRMFVGSCKRLRLMKSSEAVNLGKADSNPFLTSSFFDFQILNQNI